MDGWPIQLLLTIVQGAAQGVIMSDSFSDDQIVQQLLLWEKCEKLKKERSSMLIQVAVYLAERGELTPSRTESIMMARRNENGWL